MSMTPRERAIQEMTMTYMKERPLKSSLPLLSLPIDGDRLEGQILYNLMHRVLAEDICIEFLGKDLRIHLEILPGKEERRLAQVAKEKDDEEFWDAIERFPA